MTKRSIIKQIFYKNINMKKITKYIWTAISFLFFINIANANSWYNINEFIWEISYPNDSISHDIQNLPVTFNTTDYFLEWDNTKDFRTYVISLWEDKNRIIKHSLEKELVKQTYVDWNLWKRVNKWESVLKYNFELSKTDNTLKKWINDYIILMMSWNNVYQKQFKIVIPERFSFLDTKEFYENIKSDIDLWTPNTPKSYITYDKYFAFDVETKNTTQSKYKTYIIANSWNNYISADIFSRDNYNDDVNVYNLSLLIETANTWNYDRAIFKTEFWKSIEWIVMSNWNFAFLISSFFDSPSPFNPWNVVFYKDWKAVSLDKIELNENTWKTAVFIAKYPEYKLSFEWYWKNTKISDEGFYMNINKDFSISDWGYWFWSDSDWPSWERIIKNFWTYLYSFGDSAGCVSKKAHQTFLNKNLEKLDIIPWINPPKTIKLWYLEYEFETISFSFDIPAFNIPMLWYRSPEYYQNDLYLENTSLEEASSKSKEFFENNDIVYPNLVVFGDNYDIKFKYTLKDYWAPKNSFKIVKIEKEEEKYIAEDWKVMNIDFTVKTLWDYLLQTNWWKIEWLNMDDREFVYSEWKYWPVETPVLKESDMPIINLHKLDEFWHYSLSYYEPYDYVTYSELCKPAIYVYTDKTEKQSVTLKATDERSYYTKLIPEFDNWTMWNYTTNPGDWNLTCSDNNNYDYLYYSIKVPNYQFNENWWQVKGSLIEKFFEDKLTKMNFNEKEKSDFMGYWLEHYKDKEAYYFVSFKYNEEFDKYVELEFNNTPKTIFRVLLESYKLDERIVSDNFKYENVLDKFDKNLIKQAERNSSFDVFEWWWVFYNVDTKSFTIY